MLTAHSTIGFYIDMDAVENSVNSIRTFIADSHEDVVLESKKQELRKVLSLEEFMDLLKSK